MDQLELAGDSPRGPFRHLICFLLIFSPPSNPLDPGWYHARAPKISHHPKLLLWCMSGSRVATMCKQPLHPKAMNHGGAVQRLEMSVAAHAIWKKTCFRWRNPKHSEGYGRKKQNFNSAMTHLLPLQYVLHTGGVDKEMHMYNSCASSNMRCYRVGKKTTWTISPQRAQTAGRPHLLANFEDHLPFHRNSVMQVSSWHWKWSWLKHTPVRTTNQESAYHDALSVDWQIQDWYMVFLWGSLGLKAYAVHFKKGKDHALGFCMISMQYNLFHIVFRL